MAFLEFLKRLYDMESEYLGPEGAGAGPGMADADAGGDLASIIAAMTSGGEGPVPGAGMPMGGPRGAAPEITQRRPGRP